MPIATATKTLNDVVVYIQRQFGDESGVQITIADITRWVNAAQMAIVDKTPIIQATATTNSVAGTQTYAFPADLIQVESVLFDGNILQPRDFEGIRYELGINNNTPGDPVYWYSWANQLYLWPVPTVVKAIAVNYSKAPTSVTGLADQLGLPDRYFDRICDYVSSKAYELDEDWQANQVTLKRFEDKLTEDTNSDKINYGSFPVAIDGEYE